MVQKRRHVLWPMAHLKWTASKWKSVLWSDESKFGILVGNHGCRVLRAKEEGDLPACYQRSVQKPASLMVWGCCFILHMPIAQPHLPKHFQHIENTLQYLASLSHLFPMSRHLTMLLTSAFEHLREKASAYVWCAMLFSGLSMRWWTCHQSDIPVMNMLLSVFPNAIHTKQNNAWRLSQYVSPFLLIPSLQINTSCKAGFCCGW